MRDAAPLLCCENVSAGNPPAFYKYGSPGISG